MVNTVNKIPSINLPFTNEQGIIHPIWYEYLRAFISSVGDSGGGSGTDNTVIAGAGIEGTGAVSTVNVGEGEGIIVNANDVAVDIIHQINAQAAYEDEILIADASNQSLIRKTSLRDVIALGSSPGGLNTYVQYNNSGGFGGDSGLTYDGAGSLGINSTLTINGTTLTSASNANKFVFNVPAGTSTTHYTFRQSTGTGSSSMPVIFGSSLSSTELHIANDLDGGGSTTSYSSLVFDKTGTTRWAIGLTGSSAGSNFVCATASGLNTGVIWSVDGTTNNMSMSQSLLGYTTASITASTTQTQGQGALTSDINAISTVANANDTVTLPAALAGRKCSIINNGANILQIFPASGDNLGAGVNTATTLASGSNVTFEAYDTTNWETVAGSSLYTDEMAQDAVGVMVGTSIVYNDAGATLQRAALTGDVTASQDSNSTTIANDAVTYAKIQNVSATDKVLGRSSSGAGDIEEIACTAAGRALIDDADASAQRTTLGLGTLATQSGTFSGTSSGTNTGDQNLFQTISVSGQSDVVADSTTDTLTLVAGTNITLTTDSSTDTITIDASGASGLTHPQVLTRVSIGI